MFQTGKGKMETGLLAASQTAAFIQTITREPNITLQTLQIFYVRVKQKVNNSIMKDKL